MQNTNKHSQTTTNAHTHIYIYICTHRQAKQSHNNYNKFGNQQTTKQLQNITNTTKHSNPEAPLINNTKMQLHTHIYIYIYILKQQTKQQNTQNNNIKHTK